MSREVVILAFIWIISIVTLLWISKNRLRITQITILFSQAVSWLTVYILVTFHIVKFPYREFGLATKMGFSHYYVLFPIIAALFIHFYPKRSGNWKVLLYYLAFSIAIPTIYVIEEKYSNLIEFLHYNWGLHVIANFILFYIVKKFVFWFQKGLADR
ncbi:hypothetical protein A8F94_24410 [Bacillus sp. FJAT-27225]|uniref:CBO0543 family protein n=1 Tax=Bacillus sp. FJAT-27225 TaxID=1743144 RepID=UPI00080C32F6|nr:CBO0543 family protein [Bacillus sp. FJAT-27225]OCA88498.1 hypothetical protein A8F94_24410 [Bacillus sp. FJAT-27225]